ncbi:MAG: GAF domain-containing protein, partial [bacterium]
RGAAWFLNKPIKVEDVLVIIRHLMEKRQLQDTIDHQVERLRLLEKQTSELTQVDWEDLPTEEIIRESEFLSKSIELIAEVLEAKKVSLMLLSRDGKELLMAKSNWILPSKIPNIRQPVTQGIAGQVASEGKPMLVEDATKNPKAKINEYTRQYESQSFIVTPLILGRKVIGVISVNDKRNRTPFTEGELAILNTLANQMSMSIATIFMVKKMEREALKLKFINEIVQTLVSSVDPSEIYRSLLSKVMTGLRAAAGALVFSDPKGKQIAFEHVSPEERLRKPKGAVPVGSGVMAKVISKGKVTIENTISGNANVDTASDFPHGLEPRNIAVTPIKANGKVLGVLAVYNKQDGLPFDGWDREILEAVSPQASMAIKQAWLYQNLIKSIDEVVETNKQLEEANKEIREKIRELDRLKTKVAT